MGGFTKLFSRILTSSVWSESNEVRITWITLLAATGPDGIARTTLPGLSRLANLSIEDTEKAVKVLCSPDRYSRTAEHEGRRIREERDAQGNLIGYFVFNYSKHRAVDATAAERKRRQRSVSRVTVTQDRRQKTEDKQVVRTIVPETASKPAAPQNPLIGDRDGRIKQALQLCREIAQVCRKCYLIRSEDQDPFSPCKGCGEESADPAEVMSHASRYKGAERSKVNPATMTDDRLLNTISDLKANLSMLRAKARPAV